MAALLESSGRGSLCLQASCTRSKLIFPLKSCPRGARPSFTLMSIATGTDKAGTDLGAQGSAALLRQPARLELYCPLLLMR